MSYQKINTYKKHKLKYLKNKLKMFGVDDALLSLVESTMNPLEESLRSKITTEAKLIAKKTTGVILKSYVLNFQLSSKELDPLSRKIVPIMVHQNQYDSIDVGQTVYIEYTYNSITKQTWMVKDWVA